MSEALETDGDFYLPNFGDNFDPSGAYAQYGLGDFQIAGDETYQEFIKNNFDLEQAGWTNFGGDDLSGVGWAAGVERLEMLLRTTPKKRRPISIIPENASLNEKASIISNELRQLGYAIDFGYSGNMKKRLKNSNKVNACACIIIDNETIKDGNCIVRDMDSGKQVTIDLSNLNHHLKNYK